MKVLRSAPQCLQMNAMPNAARPACGQAAWLRLMNSQ
jgi:hypothetical protein